MEIGAFQKLIEDIYLKRDGTRGLEGSFMWFMEEVGELATGLREDDRDALSGEFADVFAWLVSLASLGGVDMEKAIRKYTSGCPVCGATPCQCPSKS